MNKITEVTGIGLPLRRTNVDTDQIIPSVYLKRVTKTGYDDALFAEWREDAAFILNRPPFDRASVLVAGADFGTGSSREHAVWALRDYGFKAVISPRFGDIFRGNAGKNGLVTAQVSYDTVEQLFDLLDANPGTEVGVDLQTRQITCGALAAPFQLDDYTRWRLMEGLDDISLTLRQESQITSFERARPDWLPRTLPAKP
ncbi:MAG: 3-isopropylmalate dehydratase small subunit, partial [Micrococcales bacterium]|nr:3-isopropylmalate dehydratase small subunit [Micrococcales bacterium]